MPPWAILRLATFNLTLLLVAIIFAVCLYRKRSRRVAIIGMLCTSVISVVLVAFTQQQKFFLIALGCSVIFLHLPLWLTIVTVLFWRYYRSVGILCIVLIVLLEAIAYDAFFIEPTALEVTRYEIVDPRIKQSMRIVVIADFQTDQIGAYERRTLQTALEQKPDLILFAGDYFCFGSIQYGQELLKNFQSLLEELHFDAPLGVYAVRGNVETWLPWQTAFHNLKGHRINHRTRSFEVGGIRLTCLSERNSFNPDLKLARPDEERFHIALGHCPNFALGDVDADLLLAGHTHGGQIQLPMIGPLSTGCQVPRSWASGMTELPEITQANSTSPSPAPATRRLIVSRGTGMERGVAPRIRFLCRPELIVIDLMPEEPAQLIQRSPKKFD